MFGKVDVSNDRAWLWYSIKWYAWCAAMTVLIPTQLYVLWRLLA